MSWQYAPVTAGPRITHTAGDIPTRPLDIGDRVQYPSGSVFTVASVTDTRRMVQYAERPGHPVWLAPVSGDHTGAIVAVES